MVCQTEVKPRQVLHTKPSVFHIKGIRALRFSESMEETRALTKMEEAVVRETAETLGLRIKKLHRRISWEEFNERWFKGLCMFCDEPETPDHHLRHKNSGILMVDCDDDQFFDDKEETHQFHETLTNPAPIEEDVNSDQICDEKELVSIDLYQQEVQTKTVTEEKLNLPNGQNIEHLVGKKFETFSTEYRSFLNLSSSDEYQKDSTWIESSLYLFFSLKDYRVWEPGGVPNQMDLWDWPETELKSYGESQQVAMFLYFLMQVVKRNPEFKTFESNKTFSLEDEQDDEPEQNQVIKLISSWNNYIWEPGGVLIEHDKWNWLEKCYNRGRLMRLMHWMSCMWCKETKSREFDRLSAWSCVDIKTWHCVKHETQQTDFHVWHRWKNKAEKLPEDYAVLELMILGLVSVWKSFGYLMEAHGSKCKGLGCVVEKKKLRNVEDGVKQDKNRFSGDVRAEIFMALEELHLLQNVFEMVKELRLKTSLVIQQVMRSKKIKFPKRWMLVQSTSFGYKGLETSDQCIRQRVFVGADRETKNNQPTLRFLMNTKQSCLSLRANRVWDPGGSNSEND